MAKAENQKSKLLHLAKIFLEETDEDHAIPLKELEDRLERIDIPVSRKTLYDDFAVLGDFGIEILSKKKGRTTVYYTEDRLFDLNEVKIMVDSIQSARFLSDKASSQIIGKLKHLTSQSHAAELQRQVVISGRVKTNNKGVRVFIDNLFSAMNDDRMVAFTYTNWNVKKESVVRKGGKQYEVSPWSLIWSEEYYYLLAWDSKASTMKHYRVDKIQKLEILDRPREGREESKKVDLGAYTRSLFGMYHGTEMQVVLRCKDSMAGVIVDRFGQSIPMLSNGDGTFDAIVNVAVSKQFLGWIAGLAPDVVIQSPHQAVDAMKEHVSAMAAQYGLLPENTDRALD